MDCVYVCRPGDNEELRYSIRSAQENLPHDKIWLVGGRPDWYFGNYLDVKSNGNKYDIVRNNIKAIINSDDISEDFILMNDDFFILKPVDEVKYLYSGSLKDSIARYRGIGLSSQHVFRMEDTYSWLVEHGINEPLDYELHVPMVMNKTNLSKVIDTKALWRSAYGNMFNVGGTQTVDIKFLGARRSVAPIPDYMGGELPYLSTYDPSFEEVRDNLLTNLFPSKSYYELDFANV